MTPEANLLPYSSTTTREHQPMEIDNTPSDWSGRKVTVANSQSETDDSNRQLVLKENISYMKWFPQSLQTIIGNYVGLSEDLLTLDKEKPVPDYLDYLVKHITQLDLSERELYNTQTTRLLEHYSNLELLKMPKVKRSKVRKVRPSLARHRPAQSHSDILSIIETSTKLQHLDLSSWLRDACNKKSMTNSVLKQLISNKKLRYINIEGSEHISDGITTDIVSCTDLQHLNLARCRLISDISVVQFAKLSSLTHLDISYNDAVTNHGLQFLDKIFTLIHLNISGLNKTTDVGIQSICKCYNLEYLNVSFCVHLTELAIEAIAELKNLKFLDIRGCIEIAHEDLSKLKNSVIVMTEESV